MIKVLIVEDSRVASQYLEYILSNEPGIEVIGNVPNGKLAVDFVNDKLPDVVTMDIDMPVMNGLEATRKIMATTPVPIIVVTVSRNAHNIDTAIEAMAAGALSIIQKPFGIDHALESERTSKLITLVKVLSQVKVVTRKYPDKRKILPKIGFNVKAQKYPPPIRELTNRKLVAIGVSSGGPQVLLKIFSRLTRHFPYPVLVVQHITEGFLENMINWLNRVTSIPIHIASDNDHLLPGHVYFAPDNFQMSVASNGIKLHKCNKEMAICPSVDFFFKSLVKDYGSDTIAILLTGMGSDGASALKLLRDAGALTIAQDEESSLVHGMPGEAIKLGGAQYVQNPDQIIDLFVKLEK